ncbi:hypothetical protein FKM82_031200 [Ascaphus truei]
MLITFDEVAVYFSQGEWEYLEEGQKELYKNVMTENYQTLHSLGWVNMKPVIISVIEQGEEPCIRCHRNTKTVDNSVSTCTDCEIVRYINQGEIHSPECTMEDTNKQRPHGEQLVRDPIKPNKEGNRARNSAEESRLHRVYRHNVCVCL